jgi:hypothetical protein
MRNCYVGDVGDFGKYGLLRKLCGEPPPLSLGVVWYLMPDEPGEPDGRHIGYLEPAQAHDFQDCDPDLYRALKELKACREVAAIERSGILRGAAFFSKPVDTGNREAWLGDALHAVAGRELVFLDPDAGLEVKSTRLNSPHGGKFCGYQEVREFLDAGASVILYQHFNHLASAAEQLKQLCRELTNRSAPPLPPFALRFHRGTGRAFLVLPQRRHEKRIQRGIEKLMASPWKRHFTRPECKIAPRQNPAG